MPFRLPAGSPLEELAKQLSEHKVEPQTYMDETGTASAPRRSSVTKPTSPFDIGTADPSAIVDVGHTLSASHATYEASPPSTGDNPSVSAPDESGRAEEAAHNQQVSTLLNQTHTAWLNNDFETVLVNLKAINDSAPGIAETQRLIGLAFFNLARQNEAQGDIEEAKLNYQTALRVEPENAAYRDRYNQLLRNNSSDR
jgi:tetratricopeptide (TPR) repeat protein